MVTWGTPTVRQQAVHKLGKRAYKKCGRCKGTKRVPCLLMSGTKRCPGCQGSGQVENASAIRAEERRLQRDWDRKQRVANARPKARLR
jgi:DnaJ-class molecular chaperone